MFADIVLINLVLICLKGTQPGYHFIYRHTQQNLDLFHSRTKFMCMSAHELCRCYETTGKKLLGVVRGS